MDFDHMTEGREDHRIFDAVAMDSDGERVSE